MTKVEAEFGVVVPSYAGDATGTPGAEEYWGLYDFPLNAEVTWNNVASFAKEAESLGYSSLWSPDHFLLGKNGMTFEVWTLLAGLSQLTSKIHLGTYVSCNNYRNPALLAKMAATLGLISNNRFILGYGAGWYEFEYKAYGFEFRPAGVRVEMMHEGIKIIQGMMKGGKFSFKGKYYSTENAVNNPLPTEKVPIMVGGWGKKTLRVAAELADEWDIGAEPTYEQYEERADYLDSELKKRNRPRDNLKRSIHAHVLIAENENELQEKKKKIMQVVDSLGTSIVELPSPDYKFELEKAIIGTPAEVRERLKKYVDLGCQRFELMFLDHPKYNSLELFSSTVF
ncbi:MAG: LLM class flavin-dependent oxidoreductase [Thaumarchaeota archaeon]|nr:LLM class flavin-dependent oxidoreductase [Nitrososphaerota archaeon]